MKLDRNSKKQPPSMGDLCTLVDNMFGLKKDEPKYIENHKKAVDLIEYLNKEYYEGYCSLASARDVNTIYHIRQKIKLLKGE